MRDAAELCRWMCRTLFWSKARNVNGFSSRRDYRFDKVVWTWLHVNVYRLRMKIENIGKPVHPSLHLWLRKLKKCILIFQFTVALRWLKTHMISQALGILLSSPKLHLQKNISIQMTKISLCLWDFKVHSMDDAPINSRLSVMLPLAGYYLVSLAHTVDVLEQNGFD